MANHDHYDDALLADIFKRTRGVAIVGASANPARPSYGVLQFWLAHGYRVTAINPGLAPDAIPGVVTVPHLANLPEPVDLVDVFRNNAAVPGVVDDVLAMRPRPAVIWMQLGVRDDASASRAEAEGLTVVMDRCPRIEWPRLNGRR